MHQAELTFRAHAGGVTQNARLAAYFKANPNRWLPMPELAQIITPTGIGAAVHSRVADCRKAGLNISHRNERHHGQVHSFYCYLPDDNHHP